MRFVLAGVLALSTVPAYACNVQLGYPDSCNVKCFDTGEMINNPYRNGVQIGPTCADYARIRAQQSQQVYQPQTPTLTPQQMQQMRQLEQMQRGGRGQQSAYPPPPAYPPQTPPISPQQPRTTATQPQPGIPPECRAYPSMCAAYQ